MTCVFCQGVGHGEENIDLRVNERCIITQFTNYKKVKFIINIIKYASIREYW